MRREANSCPLQKNSHFLTPLSFLRQTAQNNPIVFAGMRYGNAGQRTSEHREWEREMQKNYIKRGDLFFFSVGLSRLFMGH